MVEEEDYPIEEEAAPPGVGDTLRAAREARGLSLADVADKTRITQRHLALIEDGDFAGLPGRTYAIGFARNYAKAVGLDQAMIAERVREELALIDPDGAGLAPRTFEPGDPARVPSAGLAWFSAFAALILLIGGSIFVWSTYIAPGQPLPWLTSDDPEVPPAQVATRAADVAPAPVPDGQVVFTATQQAWVRFYERGGPVLMEREMLPGETYVVPFDATDPMIVTARPDLLEITVGGQEVPKLAEEQDLVEVPVTAAALLARKEVPAAETALAPVAGPVGEPSPTG